MVGEDNSRLARSAYTLRQAPRRWRIIPAAERGRPPSPERVIATSAAVTLAWRFKIC